jgi:CarD family transcriptional regulator
LSFKVGEKIVYPNHGVTVVENIGKSSYDGTESTFYHLRLLANNSRLMVPVSNIERVGLRPLYGQKQVKGLLALLEERNAGGSRDWKDRYRENVEKMKTGRLEDVADVLRNLNLVSKRKSLSFREKKMYERAKHLLVSEIAIIKEIAEPEAEHLIEKSLSKSIVAVDGH